jgi:hypothetical protein
MNACVCRLQGQAFELGQRVVAVAAPNVPGGYRGVVVGVHAADSVSPTLALGPHIGSVSVD